MESVTQGTTRTEYKYERPIEAEELRIVTLHPSFQFEAEIQCDLEIFRRNASPEYTALSYWWGPPDQALVDIQIGANTLQIREELATALRHLRHAEESKKIWTDAICIIQAPHDFEKEDKDEQLTSMDRTYKQASDVVIWLGRSSEDERSWLAMVAIDQLGAQLGDYLPIDVPTVALTLPLINLYEPDEYFIAIGKLFRRRWFRRLWVSTMEVGKEQSVFIDELKVIQEVCLAPSNLTVRCGRHEVAFWKFLHLQLHPAIMKRSLDNYTLPNNAQDRYMDFARGLEPPLGLMRQFFLENSKQEHLKEHGDTISNKTTQNGLEQLQIDDTMKKRCTLLSLVWDYRGRECSQDEDRVYAFLGMACDIPKRVIKPKSGYPDSTFEKTTRTIIEYNKRLDVLGMCCGPEDNSIRPSWVPDMRPRGSTRPLLPLTNYRWTAQGYSTERAFHATKDSAADFKFVNSEASELVVKGLRIGVITASGYEGAQDGKQALSKARSLAEGLKAAGRDVVDDFWRTLITNRAQNGMEPPTDFRLQFDIWWAMFNEPMQRTPENQIKVLGYTMAFNQQYFTRDFFITDQNYMGLCNLTRKMGDVICLLGGAQVPFVLRPCEGRYRVVGECYVHGAMNGELWDESKLTDVHLF